MLLYTVYDRLLAKIFDKMDFAQLGALTSQNLSECNCNVLK